MEPPFTRLLRPVYSTRTSISLFDALTPSASGPVFPDETVRAVTDAVARFYRVAVAYGVPARHITILATEAMRRASNASQVLDAIRNSTEGLRVSILEPAVETLFGAVMGARSGLIDVSGGALFLDLGGGSVQMTWVDTARKNYEFEAAKAGVSMPFGAARLIRVLEEEPTQVQAAELFKLKAGMHDAYLNLADRFPALANLRTSYQQGRGGTVDVYMCGGGFRGYGSMLMHNDPVNPYPIASANGYTAPGHLFTQTERMRRTNKEYDGRIFGLSKRRRRQFPAIIAVIEAFLTAVPNIEKVTFCSGSNRQGALLMKLPVEIRESNPLDVLAAIAPDEKPVFDAVLSLLKSTLPANVDLHNVPTIFRQGLDALFVRDVWQRQGHDSDYNTAFALHNAVSRDPEIPGLTHIDRALLALALASRWGGNLGSIDVQVYRSLFNLVKLQNEDASFWATVVGAVANMVAWVFPAFPKSPEEVTQKLRFINPSPILFAPLTYFS